MEIMICVRGGLFGGAHRLLNLVLLKVCSARRAHELLRWRIVEIEGVAACASVLLLLLAEGLNVLLEA
eukprot:101323-Prymnesium_polylepis.1